MGEDGASDFVLLGFDVELEAGDWPRGGRGREGSSGACSLVLEGEETTSPMSASKPNPRDASPSQRRGKRIKGGETPPKSSIGHSCAHIFSETSFARPLATRLVVEPTRARAQNNRLRAFASRRVHLSSRARLVSKRSPPPLSFPSKTSFFFDANLCLREEEKTKAKKDAFFRASGARWERGAASREQKKGEEDEGSNAPVLDRLERKNGAVVGMVADMFFFFFVLVCARQDV